MNDPIVLALCAAIPASIAAIGSVLNHYKVDKVSKQVQVISVTIDGRLKQLLESRTLGSYKQGHADEASGVEMTENFKARDRPDDLTVKLNDTQNSATKL